MSNDVTAGQNYTVWVCGGQVCGPVRADRGSAERFVVRGSRESRVVRPRASGSAVQFSCHPTLNQFANLPLCCLDFLISSTVYR